MKQLTLFILAALLLVGCGPSSAETPPTSLPSAEPPVVAATDAVAPAPTATRSAEPATAVATAESPTPTPIPTEAPTETASAETVTVISGQTAAGAFFLGDPDAPLTIIDYSDLM